VTGNNRCARSRSRRAAGLRGAPPRGDDSRHLAFAREQRLERDTIDVSRLLEDVVRLWHPAASARHIALRTEICQPWCARADGSKLHRVLDNLVKNALEAIGDGPGEVKLSAAVSDSARVRISVEDSGPGIADDVEVFRLFETTKKDGRASAWRCPSRSCSLTEEIFRSPGVSRTVLSFTWSCRCIRRKAMRKNPAGGAAPADPIAPSSAPDALSAGERRFRVLIEKSWDGIALVDGDGRFST